jgi:hypothetical protein
MRNLLLTFCALLILAGCDRVAAPEAAATGPADTVPVGGLVLLDGAASSDPQGRALEYRWRLSSKPSGSVAEIADPTLAVAWLRPDAEGDYAAQLIVSNGALTSEASVSFKVQCGAAAPVASITANPAQAASGEIVSLVGSFTDLDLESPCSLSQQHTFAWSLIAAPAGSAARLTASDGPRPFFVPDLPGAYRVRLVVTDSTGKSGEAVADVEALQCGATAPVIEAIEATPARIGHSVQLSAMALDPDAAPPCSRDGELSFAWRLADKPAASGARFDDPSLEQPSFVPDIAGTYLVDLTVTDSTGRNARSELSIEVSGCGANAPQISSLTAAPAAPITGQAVSLSVEMADVDNDEGCAAHQQLSVRWTLLSLPAGSQAALSSTDSIRPWFRADVPGEYRFSAQAFDDTGRASEPVAIAVPVSVCGSAAPVAQIDAPPSAAIGAQVRVSAVASDSDIEQPCGLTESLSWFWSFASLPSGSDARLNGAQLAAPTFVPDVAGDYVLRLVVVDAAGHHSAPALATVSVGSCGGSLPVAIASAAPLAPGLGQAVQLEASASDADNDEPCLAGQSFGFRWSFDALPAGSHAALNSESAIAPSFRPDVPGDYVLSLIAIDSTGRRSAPATVTVSASSCGGAAPVASATATPSSTGVGQPVQLHGSFSDADNSEPCLANQSFGYRWSFE